MIRRSWVIRAVPAAAIARAPAMAARSSATASDRCGCAPRKLMFTAWVFWMMKIITTVRAATPAIRAVRCPRRWPDRNGGGSCRPAAVGGSVGGGRAPLVGRSRLSGWPRERMGGLPVGDHISDPPEGRVGGLHMRDEVLQDCHAPAAPDDLRVERDAEDSPGFLFKHVVEVSAPHSQGLVVAGQSRKGGVEKKLHLREVVECPGDGELNQFDLLAPLVSAVTMRNIVPAAPVRLVVGAHHARVVYKAVFQEQADGVGRQVPARRAVALRRDPDAPQRFQALLDYLALVLLVEIDLALVQVTMMPDLVAGVSDLGADLRERVDRVAGDVEGGLDLLACKQAKDAGNTNACSELPAGQGGWRVGAEAAQPHGNRVEVEGQTDGRAGVLTHGLSPRLAGVLEGDRLDMSYGHRPGRDAEPCRRYCRCR